MTLKTYLIDGDKGGVGKSLTTRALAHYFLTTQTPPVLAVFDADMSNPDVCGDGGLSRRNALVAQAQIIDLSIEHGWIEFATDIDTLRGKYGKQDIRVIVNMPAQIGARAFQANMPIVAEVLREANVFPIWLISRLEESIRTLDERIKVMPERFRRGLVLRNLFFGSPEKFLLWENSPLRAELISGDPQNPLHWAENNLPEINDAVITRIGRTPFHIALKEGIDGKPLPYGYRLALDQWLKQTQALFQQTEQWLAQNSGESGDD